MLGGILSGVSDAFNTVFNIASGVRKDVEEQKRYEYDKEVQRTNNSLSNAAIQFYGNQGADYGFSKFLSGLSPEQLAQFNSYDKFQDYRNFMYQKEQNEITRQREDTAIQRRVADLKAAGLSPLLATGQGASAATVSGGSAATNSSSPQNYKQPTGTQIQGQNPFLSYANYKQVSLQAKLLDYQTKKVDSEIAKLDAETSKTQTEEKKVAVDTALNIAQTKKTYQEIKNLITQNEQMLSTIGLNKAQEKKFKAELSALLYNLALSKKIGVRTTDSLNSLYTSILHLANDVLTFNPTAQGSRDMANWFNNTIFANKSEGKPVERKDHLYPGVSNSSDTKIMTNYGMALAGAILDSPQRAALYIKHIYRGDLSWTTPRIYSEEFLRSRYPGVFK